MDVRVAWLGERAAEQVHAVGWHGRPAEELGPDELRACTAVVLTPEHLPTLRGWRATGLTAPAIVLTAAADAIEQRPALEPVVWSPPDGDLRIALERLSAGMRAPVLVLGPITVDLDRRSVAGTREERLTGLEARVLGYLAARRGRVIPKEELLAEVWGYRSSNTNTVPVMIGRIRKKIEVDHARPLWLLTARGGGYRLVHGPDGEPEGDVLPGRHEALRQATAALRDGRVWVSGPPGAGRAQLVRTLLAGRDVLWVTVHGTTTLPGLLEQLGVRLGQRLERLQDVAVEAVVLESADTLPADVVEAVAAGLEVPLVAIRTAPWACEGEVRLGPLEPHEAREHLVRLAATRGVALEDGVAGDLARRADGSVLALELIASWLPSVPAEALLHVLDEGLAHDDRVMAPVRAATGSLTPAERTALQGLAGFVGPFDRRTAARWLGPGVLHLGALERRGMVREDPTGLRVPPLVGAAVGPPDLERHDTKLLALVREVLPTLRTPTSELDGLAGLLPDLRATASRATGDDAVDVGRALTAVLALHGDYRSRLEVAEGALARCTTPETLARARVLLAENTRDHRQRVELLDQADPHLEPVERAWARYRAANDVLLDARWDDGLARLDGIRDAPADLRLLVASARAWALFCAGRLADPVQIDQRLGYAERLLHLGAVEAAARVVIATTGKLRLYDAPRCLRPLREIEAALGRLQAPDVRIQLAIALAELVAEVEGDLDGALALLAGADALAARFEPTQIGLVAGVRGTLLLDAGRIAEARESLLDNLVRERADGTPVRQLSVLLDLMGLELLDADPTAALRWVEEGGALGLDRYASYVDFERGAAHALAGRLDAALAAFDAARAGEINTACGVSLGLRALSVCRRAGVDEAGWRMWLDGLLATGTGRLVADARALLEGWAAGAVGEVPVGSALQRVDRLLLALA